MMSKEKTGMRGWRAAVAVVMAVIASCTVGIVGAPQSFAASCTATWGYFTPVRAVVTGVGGVTVLGVGLTSAGQLGAPPKNNTGLHEFGWYDRGYPPGYGSGSVAMDAHVYFPNGTLRSTQGGLALGNALLLHLQRGGTITLYNAGGTKHVCFTVTSRTQYTPAQAAAQMTPLVYGHPGYEQLGIIVCSGTRLGNGTYTRRTIWYAHAARPVVG